MCEPISKLDWIFPCYIDSLPQEMGMRETENESETTLQLCWERCLSTFTESCLCHTTLQSGWIGFLNFFALSSGGFAWQKPGEKFVTRATDCLHLQLEPRCYQWSLKPWHQRLDGPKGYAFVRARVVECITSTRKSHYHWFRFEEQLWRRGSLKYCWRQLLTNLDCRDQRGPFYLSTDIPTLFTKKWCKVVNEIVCVKYVMWKLKQLQVLQINV